MRHLLPALLLPVLCHPVCTCLAQSPAVVALYEKARADQAQGSLNAAVSDYLQIIKLDPGLASAYNNLGRIYYNLGSYQQAVTTLRQGLVLDPAMHPAELILGASYYQLGLYDQAILPLTSAVTALPRDRFARLTLIHALIGGNKLEAAENQLSTMVATGPNDQEAWYLLGKLQLARSQQSFARAHAIDPNSALAHELSGEIMESMKNTQGATAEYRKAVAIAPGDPGALEHLADGYWHSGQWKEAALSFTHLLQVDPTNCRAHWKLANSLNELGEQPEQALQQASVAIAMCSTLEQARVERARVSLRLGQPKQALEDLLHAEQSAPDEPSIQILLSRTYRALGDTVRADAASAAFERLQQSEHAETERHAADVLQTPQQ